jgi:hypothetical protein
MSINWNRVADNFVDELFLVALGFILSLMLARKAITQTSARSCDNADPESKPHTKWKVLLNNGYFRDATLLAVGFVAAILANNESSSIVKLLEVVVFSVPFSDGQRWNNVIRKAKEYDVYHTHQYHALDLTGSPELFVVEQGDHFIALPLIKRHIPGTPYFDCTSVYGYAGPITNCAVEHEQELFKKFRQELSTYLQSQNIISAFSRLHPLFDQSAMLAGLGNIKLHNQTVGINLSLPLDIQRQGYRKSNKWEVNYLRKHGFSIRKASTSDDVAVFTDIYRDTMVRLKADERYYFDQAYFERLLNATDFESDLLLASYNNETIAGSVFTKASGIVQYHLSGTKTEYVRSAPMKLVIDEARIKFTAEGHRCLHLGGGYQGSDSDSLFEFKSGFSNLRYQFATWRLVVNEAVYCQLAAQAPKTASGVQEHFPLYRS